MYGTTEVHPATHSFETDSHEAHTAARGAGHGGRRTLFGTAVLSVTPVAAVVAVSYPAVAVAIAALVVAAAVGGAVARDSPPDG